MRLEKAAHLSKVISITSILALSIISCVHDPVTLPQNPGNPGTGTGSGTGAGSSPCDPKVVYFEKQILPMLLSNCAMSGCHDAGSAQDGVILTSYSSLLASDIVDPGDADNSDLIEVLTETDLKDRMPRPPAEPFSSEQINLIRTWINQGAQNIICKNSDCDSSNVTYSGIIKPLLQNSCLGCHNSSGASGGVDLSSHATTQTVALNGRLYGSVSHMTPYKAMPQGGSKMNDCDLSKIRKWIDDGAPNN